MSGQQENKILVVPPLARGNLTEVIARVARQEKVSPFRQFYEILRLQRKPSKMTAHEYFAFQLYRASMSLEEKRQFIGEKGNYLLNLRLAPPGLTHMRGFLSDKVTFLALMQRLGMATAETQAMLTPDRDLGTIETLGDSAAVEDFLLNRARYPLFCKPVTGYQALGTVGIAGLDRAQRKLTLVSGREVDLSAFAAEAAADFRKGYLFQTAVQQHPEVAEFAGQAVSTVRVVTVVEEDRPRPLYAVWKIPSPTAMSDNSWQPGSMICLLDVETGTVQRCRRGTGPDTEWLENHPDSGKPIVGFRLPHFASVADLAVSAHSVFPVNGMLGWDIAIGPQGAILIECNENTGHLHYQNAADEGALNPAFKAVFDRVIARNRRLVREYRQSNKQVEARRLSAGKG